VARSNAEPASDYARERGDADRDEAMDRADPRVMHPQVAEQELEQEGGLERNGSYYVAPRCRGEDEPDRPGRNEGNAEGAVRVVARRTECAGAGEKELSGDAEKRQPRDQAVEA
jgi:hypothetical protein